MIKVDPTVKKETLYIAAWEVVLCVLMNAVFLILSRWDLTVLLGTLLGAFVAVLNFFLLGLSLQKSLTYQEKKAASFMKLSKSFRMLGIVLVALFAYLAPVFSLLAAVLPLLFPRLAIAFRPLFDKKEDSHES